jgi:hypothetical protein
MTARHRVRHWVDGLVIGSEIFVRETMRRVRTEAEVARHRLATADAAEFDAAPVCCWRRLRVLRLSAPDPQRLIATALPITLGSAAVRL